jgi:hypothetical protein
LIAADAYALLVAEMLYQQDADRLLEEQRARQEAELSGQKQAFSLLALLVQKYKY